MSSTTQLDRKKGTQIAALRSTASFTSVEVDDAASAIKNAAVMTVGDAGGHGFSIDATTLQQVAALINAKPNGVPVRFKHPKLGDEDEPPEDALGTDVGYLRNARIDGACVRGDVYLGEWSSNLPTLGDVKSYLLSKAKNDPAGFGLSAVIGFDVEEQMDALGNIVALPARVGLVAAVDFVGKPAANPNGLLAAKPATDRGISLELKVGNRTMTFSAPTIDQVIQLKKASEDTRPLPTDAPGLMTQLAEARSKKDVKAIAKSIAALAEIGIRVSFPKPKK